MPSLDELFAAMKDWQQPPGGGNPFKIECRIGAGASPAELDQVAPATAATAELRQLWTASREAWLFVDAEYGQWGLHMLSPGDSAARTASMRAERPDDIRPDDVVLGEFLGDSELLVYAPAEQGARRLLIALPLDGRADWFGAGSSVAEVLARLRDADGDKYWRPA
jgi:hypothetical protein